MKTKPKTINRIDDKVIIDYIPSRKIKVVKSKIGKNPRIRAGSVIYTNCEIGKNLETGHSVIIREENKIGNDFKIWNNSTVDYGCKIGNNVRIHCNVYICQYALIEDDVFIAPGVMLANDLYPVNHDNLKGPIIRKGARLGINATVLPGVTIGEYSLIGAGSVVTKDVPLYAVACGNPATIKRFSKK